MSGADAGDAGDAGGAELADEREGGQLLSQEYLRRSLRAARDPLALVDALQAKHAPGLQKCEPVLGFLEVLGFKRVDLYRDLCNHLKTELLTRARRAPSSAQADLLLATLPFINFGQPLEDVPLRILEGLPNPPEEALEMLSTVDAATFNKLSQHAKRQVWERYPDSFQTYFGSLIERYLTDAPAIMWTEELYPDINVPPPHKRRQKTKVLQEMIRAIGSSRKLYRFAVDQVRDRFVASNNSRLCALRADLLMGLHDVLTQTNSPQSTILATEPCHSFAWHLDAYIKQVFVATQNGGAIDMKTAQLQRSVVSELEKVINGIFKPELASAFASSDSVARFGTPLLGAVGAGAGAGAGAGGASKLLAKNRSRGSTPGTSDAKKPVDLHSVLLEAYRKIKSSDRKYLFLNPVIESYPQLAEVYLAKIKQPMDLQTIGAKLNKRDYTSIDEMRKDLHLIADNAIAFNGKDSEIGKTAERLMKVKAENYLNVASSKLENALQEAKTDKLARAAPPAPPSLNESSHKPAAAKRLPPPDETPDQRRTRLRKEAEKRYAALRKEETDALQRMEAETRVARTISDAAMVLANGSATNALTQVLLFLVGEEVIKSETLPRDAELLRNISWLLQIASQAHGLVECAQRGESLHIHSVSPVFLRQVLPSIASIRLDCLDHRMSKPNKDSDAVIDPLNKELGTWCKRDWVVRKIVLNLLCDSVCRCDREIAGPLFAIVEQLGALATDDSSFLHSLVTAFFIASRGGARDSMPARLSSSSITHQASPSNAKALSELLADAFKAVLLPAVLKTADLSTSPIKVARQHVHFSRLLMLEVSLLHLSRDDIGKFARTALLSLAGVTGEDPVNILASAELKETIFKRYMADSFARAQRQYEKLFRRFPAFRTPSGLPPVAPQYSRMASPSPSPSPFVTPSPSPSPYAPSPFQNSPYVPAGSDGGVQPGSPAKRPLDTIPEDGESGTDAAVKRPRPDDAPTETAPAEPNK